MLLLECEAGRAIASCRVTDECEFANQPGDLCAKHPLNVADCDARIFDNIVQPSRRNSLLIMTDRRNDLRHGFEMHFEALQRGIAKRCYSLVTAICE